MTSFVDDELQYETFVDYLRNERYTFPAGVDGMILLRGQFESSIADDEVANSIKSVVEAATQAQTLMPAAEENDG